MLSLDRPRFTTRTVAYIQRPEFSVECKFHGILPEDAPNALARAVNACLQNALDGRELVGGTVDMKIHAKDQVDTVVSFSGRPMCVAEVAVLKMDEVRKDWRDTFTRRGSLEVFLAATVKNVLDANPDQWWLAERKTHAQVQRERVIVEKQGWNPAKLRAFNFREFRSGQILLTPAAATKTALQYKAANSSGRAVPYPMPPRKTIKEEPVDLDFQALEKHPVNF